MFVCLFFPNENCMDDLLFHITHFSKNTVISLDAY